jgi:hypothetical protein
MKITATVVSTMAPGIFAPLFPRSLLFYWLLAIGYWLLFHPTPYAADPTPPSARPHPPICKTPPPHMCSVKL